MEILAITALAVASRAFASRETGATALLSAGHTYTQTRREYCPACDAVLAQVGGPTVELDADGNEYHCDLGPDPSDIHPEDCTCDRDPLTGARHFGPELRGVEVRGIRRANDASEMQLRYAVALEDRALDMAEAAAVAALFGDRVEVERCETDVEALLDLAHDIVAELPEQTSNGADGANLNTEDMLDGCGYFPLSEVLLADGTAIRRDGDDGDPRMVAGGTARWEHERDAYLSAEMPRRERCESTLRDFERVDSEANAELLARLEVARQAAKLVSDRWATYMRLRKDILRSRSMERRAQGAGRYDVARRWNQRAFAVVKGAQSRYRDGVQAAFATDSGEPDWSRLYLTKQQMSSLWALNERRIAGIEALVRCFYFGK